MTGPNAPSTSALRRSASAVGTVLVGALLVGVLVVLLAFVWVTGNLLVFGPGPLHATTTTTQPTR